MRKILLSFILCFLCGNAFATPEDDLVNFYKKFLTEEFATTNLDDYTAVNLKYATKARVTYFAKFAGRANGLPQSFKDSEFDKLKSDEFKIADLQVKKVNIDGDNASIDYAVSGRSNDEGMVTFVKEDGDWKIGGNVGQSNASSTETQEAPVVAPVNQISGIVQDTAQVSDDQAVKSVPAAVEDAADTTVTLPEKKVQAPPVELSSQVRVYLKNGNVVEGRLTEETAKYIKIVFQGVVVTYYNDEFSRIEEISQ